MQEPDLHPCLARLLGGERGGVDPCCDHVGRLTLGVRLDQELEHTTSLGPRPPERNPRNLETLTARPGRPEGQTERFLPARCALPAVSAAMPRGGGVWRRPTSSDEPPADSSKSSRSAGTSYAGEVVAGTAQFMTQCRTTW